MATRETGAQRLKASLDRYLQVNDLVFQSNKKLEEIDKIANSAIISQGLILNSMLCGYLAIVTSEDSMKRNGKDEIVEVFAEIFDLNRDIVTLIELVISEDCATVLMKKELAKYVQRAMQRVGSQIKCIEQLVKAHTNDSSEAN